MSSAATLYSHRTFAPVAQGHRGRLGIPRIIRAWYDFLNRNENSEEARAIVAAEQREIELNKTYKAHVNYGVYVAKKPG